MSRQNISHQVRKPALVNQVRTRQPIVANVQRGGLGGDRQPVVRAAAVRSPQQRLP